MTRVLTRALIFVAALGSLAGALILSSAATHARTLLQEGANNVRGQVVQGSRVIGQDPDINVRHNILRDFDNTNGDGGDGGQQRSAWRRAPKRGASMTSCRRFSA